MDKLKRYFPLPAFLATLGLVASIIGQWWLEQAIKIKVNYDAPNISLLTPSPTTSTPTQPFAVRKDIDALLVVDFSKSMCGARCGADDPTPNDPENIRLTAAELMIASLASDVFPRATRMGYIAFGESAIKVESLQKIENPEVRKQIINSLRKPDYTGYTNIEDALRLSYEMLYTDSRDKNTNSPVIVLLTDGQPFAPPNIGLPNTQLSIENAVKKLTDKGAIIYVVILRNTKNTTPESLGLTEWRGIWHNMSINNNRVAYVEASIAEELPNIYNKLRAKVLAEGTKVEDIKNYDPLKDSIKMPPNLLQANLLVSKPSDTTISLIAPDGRKFPQLALVDTKNEEFQGDLYVRYRLNRPIPGNWRIETSRPIFLKYVLNPESLFSLSIAARGADPAYVNIDDMKIPIVVVNDKGQVINEAFDIQLYSSQSVRKPDGSLIEEDVPLTKASREQPNTPIYIVDGRIIKANNNQLSFKASGVGQDGSLVNMGYLTVSLALVPGDISLGYLPQVPCDHEQIRLYPPTITCGNHVAVTAQVQDSNRLVTNSLLGNLNTDFLKPIQMTQTTNGLQTQLGVFPTIGNYGFTVSAAGNVVGGYKWNKQAKGKIEITVPAWVAVWQKRLWTAMWLLVLCVLWKPFIVPILLRLLTRLKILKWGWFALADDTYASSSYEHAKKNNQLFAIRIGSYKNSDCDIKLYEELPTSLKGPRLTRSIIAFLTNRMMWGRLFVIPFKGLYVENSNGEVSKAGKTLPTSARFMHTAVKISQHDWLIK